MKYPYLLCFACLLFLLPSCKTDVPETSDTAAPALERMKTLNLTATTQRKYFYQNIPSASGVERVQDSYYIMGDDSPFLYKLNEQFQLLEQHALFDTAEFSSGRIPKASKPDLESMAHFTYGRDEMLLLLGSGASEARNRGFLVNLSEGNAVRELDMSRFYTFLKHVLKLETEGELNLEGLALDKTYVYLLQRPAGGGANVLIRLDADAFKRFVMEGAEIPAAAVYHFTLPAMGQNKASFSGAYASGDRLFFTASVEDTPNAIEDGEVLGSYIGVIDLNALPYATDSNNPLNVPTVLIQNSDGSPYLGKAESLVVLAGEEQGQYEVVVVSDDDLGHSELLEVQLQVQ
ncbi:DUF6929 family protein [Pontibacter akesuensis]|uniref:DUF4397 domain-containing protein n=1 Tax=Pontibacter akesuensis TaxID=388950 RepID=A0A1I7K8H9_9BACT|nr:hypothetical protein [Pontibacter akesuensis]GHA74316.1 hypothetical protein GCM10007389_30000 [Pontibacter akesuensis]SFU93708.1 hypothetical protein SAMN04487941_3507 [Pontibacter akesuensis]